MSLPLGKHERDFAALLWSEGPLSRRDIVERTGTHPTLVGNAAAGLIRRGIARESSRTASPTATSPELNPDLPVASPKQATGGRPRLPLEIDPDSRHVVGVAIQHNRVGAVRVNLQGHVIAHTDQHPVPGGGPGVVRAAAALIAAHLGPQTLSVGVSVPGFVDPAARRLLLSSASPETRDLDLSPIYAAAPDLTTIVHNDMHALAARWQLSQRAPKNEDVLLAWIADGSIGASLLVAGRPNRGCVTGAAELGHIRTPLSTPTCFCGRQGCLERVFSSAYLNTSDLAASLVDQPDPSLITSTLGTSLADVANLIRPHRIVIASPYAAIPLFRETLSKSILQNLLPGLADRTKLDWWTDPALATPETAAWLALSTIYHGEWN